MTRHCSLEFQQVRHIFSDCVILVSRNKSCFIIRGIVIIAPAMMNYVLNKKVPTPKYLFLAHINMSCYTPYHTVLVSYLLVFFLIRPLSYNSTCSYPLNPLPAITLESLSHRRGSGLNYHPPQKPAHPTRKNAHVLINQYERNDKIVVK